MSVKSLQEYTRYAKYAQYIQTEKRRETWKEQTNRVFDMHEEKLGAEVLESIRYDFDFAKSMVNKKRVLGSQRALQFGGKAILDKNARMYNCFKQNTEFITDRGVKSFEDFADGDVVTVLTHTGSWKSAIVKSYGQQQLNQIGLKKGSSHTTTVSATPDHRWILSNGTETTSIKVGDRLYRQPNTFNEWEYASASPDEKLYWAYGLVAGDGTLVKDSAGDYKHSMIRLCGHDKQYAGRFEELGFKTSTSLSLNGDVIAYTGTYLKTLPNPEKDSVRLLRAFVRGLLDADGEKNKNSNGSLFLSIQQTNKDVQQFIRDVFPVVGVYVVSETPVSHETNFGTQDAIQFRVSASMEGSSPVWRVDSITENTESATVWCLEVEDDNSFVLPQGIVTGNCTVSYVDRPRFFQECFYLLLCGCGAGFSVQKHHVARLPKIQLPSKDTKTFIVPDTIEGWSDALGVLLASYWESDCTEFSEYQGHKIVFDYSQIRPEGAPLSWGGKAPGPNGLFNAMEKIREILDRCCTDNEATSLRPIDAYDITMHASDAVLSGGIRRSATICLFSHEDSEMVNAKTGNWFVANPQRGRSNNSAVLVRNEVSKDEFNVLMDSVRQCGEPGFVWAEDSEALYNPCVTKDAWIMTDSGPKHADSLIGQQFTAMVNGKGFDTTEKGFFATGTKDVFKITTKEGHELKLTDNHKVLVNSDGSEKWVESKDLVPGNKIILHKHESLSWDGSGGGKTEGWLIGSFLGDGCVSGKSVCLDYWGESREEESIYDTNLNTYKKITGGNQTANVGKKRLQSAGLYRLAEQLDIIDKNIGAAIETASSEFYCGFMSGWFDADGSVHGNTDSGISVRLHSSNLDNLKAAQRMLLRLGIDSSIYKNRRDAGYRSLPDRLGGHKEYFCDASHDLIISKSSMFTFADRIGFVEPEKAEKLLSLLSSYKRKPSQSKFETTFTGMELVGPEDVYDCTVPGPHAFDANGLYVHNCVEIGMWAYWENDGSDEWKSAAQTAYEIKKVDDKECISGWQFCNLSEINMRKCKTEEDFMDACRAASILGTIQASYDWFDYLGVPSHKIVAREALLGCSMTGMMDSPEIAFDPEIQQKGAKIILETNKRLAQKLGINIAARTTCVKPAGTTSCILGSASGVHPHHAKRYIRRVQANKMEFPAQHFGEHNPLAVEDSVWSANNTDVVLSFCCEVPDGSKTKNQIGGLDLLEYVRTTQQNWVKAGTRESKSTRSWLRHNVSNTITVRPDEWDAVGDFIYKNRRWFAGISLLPFSGDLDYPQAPFVAIYTPTEIVREYGDGSLMASGLIVDGLRVFNNNLWAACDCALGIGESLDLTDDDKKLTNGTLKALVDSKVEKGDWARRVQQFADKYCGNDQGIDPIKRATYMMKCVHNWKLWCDLNRQYIDIDWSGVVEEDYQIDMNNFSGGAACSGGACETGDLGESIKSSKQELVKS